MFRLASFLLIAGLVLVGVNAPTKSQPTQNPGTQVTIPVAGTVAASTQIVALKTGARIYVTSLLLVPVATSVVTLTSGTGTNCGSNTTSLTGALTFAAAQTVNLGDGTGAVLATLPGHALCITIATAAAPGSLAYAQF